MYASDSLVTALIMRSTEFSSTPLREASTLGVAPYSKYISTMRWKPLPVYTFTTASGRSTQASGSEKYASST